MNFVAARSPELDILDFRDHSHTIYAENGAEAQFSPNGKWVAFSAPGSSSPNYLYEVFVSPFPGPGGRVQISNGGGAQARWRGDGKELYYIDPDKKLMAVSINTKEWQSCGRSPPRFVPDSNRRGTHCFVSICGFTRRRALPDQFAPSRGSCTADCPSKLKCAICDATMEYSGFAGR